MKTVGTGNKRRLIEIEEAVVLVPILKTTQMLLNNEMVVREVWLCTCMHVSGSTNTDIHRSIKVIKVEMEC